MYYDIDKFEVAFEYIHKYGKRLYIEQSFKDFSYEMLTEIKDTYALPCIGRMFISREGNRIDGISSTHKHINIIKVKEIYEATSNRVWYNDKDPSYEFITFFDYIIHNWSSIRLIKT